MIPTARTSVLVERPELALFWRRRGCNIASVMLLLAALAFEVAGKSFAGRALTTSARGGDHTSVIGFVELSGLFSEIGLVLAACAGICVVVSIAKGERGPHWPIMLTGGIYIVFLLIAV